MDTTPATASEELILIFEVDEFQLAGAIPNTELPWPKNNFIATNILARLLNTNLEPASQPGERIIFGGPLNHSIFICSVPDVDCAAKTVWTLLQDLRLDSGAQIFRFDRSVNVFRGIFPVAGDDAGPDFVPRKILEIIGLGEIIGLAGNRERLEPLLNWWKKNLLPGYPPQ